jgi:hypothetical protein
MIARLKFLTSDNQEITMLFGKSYKRWDEQFKEWCRLYKPNKLLFAESSAEQWKAWGGLKWCEDSDFQAELNREGCQENEPDNQSPRQYKSMWFKMNPIVFNIANKYVETVKDWNKPNKQ